MFDGEEDLVTMQFDNQLAGVVIDRFGKDISFFPVDDNHFQITVKVAVSRQFLGWVIALGSGAKLVSPDNVVDRIKKIGDEIMQKYRE